MKRKAVLLCLVILVIITGSLYSNATQIILKVNYPKMVLDNDEIDIGYYEKVVPVIVNNRTMVPIRSIVTVLGGVVNWDDNDEKISIEYNDRKIEMRVNDNNITVDGEGRHSDVPPMIIGDRTMVPLRFVSENFGLSVNWDGKNKKITINTNQQDFEKYKGQISFWHYNVEESAGIVKAFNKVYPNIAVNLTVNTLKNMEYQNKLTAAIRAGSEVPDIFASEGSFVKRFVDDNDFYMDISDRARELSGNMVPYTIDLGTNYQGEIKALSNQVSVGSIIYKKSVAKKYLGTNDPIKIAEMFSTEENMLETGKKLKEKSKGKVALFCSWEDVEKMYLGGRSVGWVVNGKFHIDQKVQSFIDLAKKLVSNKYETGYSEGTSGYNAAIASDESFLATVLPPSGISQIIGKIDKKAYEGRRWGIAEPPFSFGCGGTWYGISNTSQEKELSWKMLKFITIDTYAMKNWAVKNDDLPNNMDLLSNKIPYSKYVNTNLAEFYEPIMRDINGKIYSKYDDMINQSFNKILNSYLNGKIASKAELIKLFKSEVENLNIIKADN